MIKFFLADIPNSINWPKSVSTDRLYRAWASGDGNYVYFETYPILRQTPKGVWINKHSYMPEEESFINLTARKQWASTTPEEAVRQLYYRMKRWEIFIKQNLARAQNAQALIRENAAEFL